MATNALESGVAGSARAATTVRATLEALAEEEDAHPGTTLCAASGASTVSGATGRVAGFAAAADAVSAVRNIDTLSLIAGIVLGAGSAGGAASVVAARLADTGSVHTGVPHTLVTARAGAVPEAVAAVLVRVTGQVPAVGHVVTGSLLVALVMRGTISAGSPATIRAAHTPITGGPGADPPADA